MKYLISLLAACVLFCGAGCETIGNTNSEHTASVVSTAESVFNTALTMAANILAAEGTQALAIAAAESYVASQIPEPHLRQIAYKLIEQAVPNIANGLANVVRPKGSTMKERAAEQATIYTNSEQFKTLVRESADKFKAQAQE